MDIYNMSHCKDLTAAIAVSRADKPRKAKKIYRAWPGLTYRIGEIAQLVWIDGRLVDTMKYKLPNAERNTERLEGIATGSFLLPA